MVADNSDCRQQGQLCTGREGTQGYRTANGHHSSGLVKDSLAPAIRTRIAFHCAWALGDRHFLEQTQATGHNKPSIGYGALGCEDGEVRRSRCRFDRGGARLAWRRSRPRCRLGLTRGSDGYAGLRLEGQLGSVRALRMGRPMLLVAYEAVRRRVTFTG
jgi:hypothetical protein